MTHGKKYRKYELLLDSSRLRKAMKVSEEEFNIKVGYSVFVRTLIEKFLQEYIKVKSLDDYEFNIKEEDDGRT